ncbi:uncharacterized protein LOC135373082 [Ornithodoros turicata]|uniref:uncharacterized protein LOC135373082 n=1 Tax=Ornithodoros turicata TaxID=34597 RepID=UPI003139DD21
MQKAVNSRVLFVMKTITGKLLSSGSFFIILDMKKRLQMLLKHVGTTLLHSLRTLSTRSWIGVYNDITDGQLYQDARRRLKMKWSDLTVSFSSDGSPAFESSNSSVWPVQIVINELPVKMRWRNVIVCGLWFAKVHPPVHHFLSAFVQHFVGMGPVVWKTLNQVVTSQIYAISCIADSPARASILNRKQFNGFYGCSWCLKKCELVDGTLKYAEKPGESHIERTHDSVLQAMKLAVLRKRDVDGVKGPSPVVKLKGLDVVWGVPPDYMHCVLLGVAKHLAELWLSSPGQGYYIGRKVNAINSRICAIRPPTSFTRLPRCPSQYSLWKASEWKNWVLYYMLPTLNGILSTSFLIHASLLTEGLFLLLQNSVTDAHVRRAEYLFKTFVYDTARLYGDHAVKFNVHQLLHLAKSVRMLGPLWATSMFPFEGGNGKVMSLFSAAKGVPLQIAERLVMNDTLQSMLHIFPLSGCVQACAEKLLKVKQESECSQGLGAVRCDKSLSDIAASLLFERVGRVVTVEHFSRARISNIIIHASEYGRTQKTCSCYLKMKDGSFCMVQEIYTFREQFQRVALLCKRLLLLPSELGHATHIHKCDHPPSLEGLCVYLDDDVDCQVVFVCVEQVGYLCEQPNIWETD